MEVDGRLEVLGKWIREVIKERNMLCDLEEERRRDVNTEGEDREREREQRGTEEK